MALKRHAKSKNLSKLTIVVDVTDPHGLIDESENISNSTSIAVDCTGNRIENLSPSIIVEGCTEAIQCKSTTETCLLCEESFENAFSFVDHVMNNHIDYLSMNLSCPFCSYSTTHKPALFSHIQIHTSEKPFSCEYCKKSFRQKVGLLQHLKSHSKVKPFACSICSSRFKSARNLEVHKEVTHFQRKSYVCKVCQMSFGVCSNLRTHMRTHTGERPYRCNVCGKTFVQKGNLDTHKRLHTGEKPFRCQYCESSFTHMGNLRQHVITQHTKDYKHRCEKCNKGFIGPAELKRHQTSSHPAPKLTETYMLFLDD